MPILSRRRDAEPVTPHVHDESCGCSRRQALASALGCGGYVLFALAGLTALERKAFAAPTGTPVTTEKFARIEKIADGVWAVVSTPFDDPQNLQPQTLSNGGIIAGSEGVLVVEGFNQPVGSAWVADMAKQLTGRAPPMWSSPTSMPTIRQDSPASSRGRAGRTSSPPRSPAT